MTDIVDLVLNTSLSFSQNVSDGILLTNNHQINDENCQIRDQNSLTKTHKNASCKFTQIDSVYTIILYIEQINGLICIVFKLLNQSEIVRMKSSFLKSYFVGQVLKSQKRDFHPKINPITGQISLQFSTFGKSMDQKQQIHFIQNLVNQMKKKRRIIVEFWKLVIKITLGKYELVENFNIKHKLQDMLHSCSLSAKQKQSQTIHNIKNQIFLDDKSSDQFISQTSTLLNMSIPPVKSQKWQYRKKFQLILGEKRVLQQKNIRATQNLCQSNKSSSNLHNFQQLTLNNKEIKKTFQSSKSITTNEVTKVNDQNLGKLFLSSIQTDQQKIQKITQRLHYIDQYYQYTFLNHYMLLKDNNKKLMFKMALKKNNLKELLQKNTNCMAFQSKLKIFQEIFYAVQSLWEKFGIYSGSINLANIDITKTFVVKIDNVQNWQKVWGEMNDLSDYDKYLCKAQMMIRLENTFYSMFYDKPLFHIRKSKLGPTNSLIQSDKALGILKNNLNSRNIQSNLYGIPQILKSIQYCFKKYENYVQQKQNFQSEQEKFSQLMHVRQQIKKGNLDLILGTINRSTEVVKVIS